MPFKGAIPLLTVLVVGYILPVSEGTAACCKSVLITASEPVASKQATRLGKFNYYKMGANGWPVYAKDRKQYLYYTKFDAWIVGGKYKSGTGGLRSFHCNAECPNSCHHKWQYYSKNSNWSTHHSIDVSCEAETTTMTPNPEISTPASTEDPDTNPGIECCDYFNVKPDCFPLCKQLDIPVNDTEDSRDMTCKTFSGVINECKSGSSGWKLDKCCKKYDVSKKCRPFLCDGECKEKPWEIDGTSTGDEECDKYIDDVSTCCGPN